MSHDPEPDPEHDHVHDAACAAAHGEIAPPQQDRRLVLVFASPVADELAVLAARLGWSTVLLDPDPSRLGASPDLAVSSVAAARLTSEDDVVLCDHGRDELGDVLAEVLAGPCRWVGVMGSLRHTAPHVEALRARGLPEEAIARVHRPIGLDIGSHTPPEIALSTLAGLVADRNGRTGGVFRG